MNSILNEISKLRKGKSFVIDNKNSNRYRVVTIEENRSKTAYYFTSPIYNNTTLKAVDMKFFSKEGAAYLTGSNANVKIAESVRMENSQGTCIISITNSPNCISDYETVCGNEIIYPTTNGIAIKSACQKEMPYEFSVEVSKPFAEVRANDKFFAFMSEKFSPFVTISCIGTTDINGKVISPAKLAYQRLSDRKYTISITPCSPLERAVLIEVNLYEPKLFQDTTVESGNPKTNNSFGSIGFVGNTKEFGEQWLYSRPDFSKMTELNGKNIMSAILHLPSLSNSPIELTASKVSSRFCSFGSTWENKISESAPFIDSVNTESYINIDLMPIISDKYGRLYKGEGFILKSKEKGSGFSVITTGDSYFKPQILEINYR